MDQPLADDAARFLLPLLRWKRNNLGPDLLQQPRHAAEVMRLDLAQITVDGEPFTGVLTEFTEQLRRIRTALEDRDYIALCDTLAYEITETTRQWRGALASIRSVVA